MKQDHRPWDKKVFRAGVNTDQEQRDVARTPGLITDAQNMRTGGDDGSNGSCSKIGGEASIYGALAVPGAGTYWCVGRTDVNGGLFEAWASDQPQLYNPLIRYNGVIIAQSPLIPYRWDQPLQFHKSEDCEGGMVFDARSKSIPIHWPVQDMVDALAAGLQTYFAGFVPSLVQVNPTRPVNRPVFLGLVDVGTGNGLKGGQFWYYIRFVNSSGDRTPDGPPVGPVFVPFERGDGWNGIGHRPWPSADTAGKNPLQVDIPTGFAPRFKIRVNNIANFDNMELVRMSWTDNAGPDALPDIQVVKRIAIQPGENQPYYLVDDGEVLDEIAPDESVVRTHFIKSAESVRYIGFRVAYLNVELGAQDVRGEWLEQGGSRIFPVTKNIGRDGHVDPVNACYKRSFKRGGRQNIGVVYWDTVGGNSYVDRLEENYTHPNRRDEKAGDSLDWSDTPTYAATVDHEVRPSYEVFDIDVALRKSQTKQVVSIMAEGRRKLSGSEDYPGQATTPIVDLSPGDPPGTSGNLYPATNDGVYIESASGGPWVKVDYTKPLPPQKSNRNMWGHDYKVNVNVHPDGVSAASVPYEPKVFAPRMHSLALAVRGLASIPDGVQGMSVVATSGTKRVVTQGIAKWKLNNGQHPNAGGTQNRASKDTWQLHVCFPELGAGALNQEVIDGILASDGRYGVQLVSPLGIVSEQFGSVMANRPAGSFTVIPFAHQDTQLGNGFSALADMLSIARVLWDTGQCNPGSSSGGYTPDQPLPGGADHFVGYDSWCNGPRPNSPWHSPGFNGNRVLQYTNAQQINHGSGDISFVLSMDAQVYGYGTCPSSDFANPATKAFLEPFYVVNIVEDAAQVDDAEGYRSLNHYIPFVSHIGTTDGQLLQQVELVDERFDDVVGGPDQERYIWLIGPQGARPFLFVGSYWGDYATILDSINTTGSWTTPDGVVVYGLYGFDYGASTQEAHITILTATEAGQRIEVRYNNRAPIVVYGDQFIAPAFGTIVDEAASALPASGLAQGAWASDTPNQVKWPVYFPQWFTGNPLITGGLPIPFANYEYNGNYMVPFGHGFGVSGGSDPRFAINQLRHGMIASVRQWKVLFDCEVSAQLFMSRYEPQFNISYPFVNYQQRPYNALPNNSQTANGMAANYSQFYDDDYPQWQFGGIKDAVLPLPLYSIHPGPAYYKIAEFGIQERTKQCTALPYSEKALPVSQDLAGLKTFPVDNIEYIEPTRGSGQFLYSHSSEAGFNLYAVMERGEKMLLIEQNIARSADGEEFAMFRQDKFIGGGQWIGQAGMPGDTWMTVAEGYPFMPGGSSERREALGWWNGESYFWLVGNSIVDMAKGSYRKGIRQIMNGFNVRLNRMSGAYDRVLDEMLLLGPGGIAAFSCSRGDHHWMGYWTHRYDHICFSSGSVHGFRDLTTYRMNSGDLINGQLVRAWVKVPSAPFQGERMEWMRLKVDSPRKPLRIEFYNEDDQLVCWTDAQRAIFLGYPDWTYMQKETNWECPVPRTNEAVNPNKPRLQGSISWYKVIFEGEGPDVISASEIQVKPLK